MTSGSASAEPGNLGGPQVPSARAACGPDGRGKTVRGTCFLQAPWIPPDRHLVVLEEVQVYARKWVVNRVGSEGWGLQHQDQYGRVGQVPPYDPLVGDTIEQCRRYFADCGLPHDLFCEPDRVFQMLPAPRRPA